MGVLGVSVIGVGVRAGAVRFVRRGSEVGGGQCVTAAVGQPGGGQSVSIDRGWAPPRAVPVVDGEGADSHG